MKSGKQKKKELQAKRVAKRNPDRLRGNNLRRKVRVNDEALGPNSSSIDPDFVTRGYYLDVPFRCKDCGVMEIWTAAKQKWWYEVAKGDLQATAVRCRSCRCKERERVREARRVHFEGIASKT